MAGTGPSFSDDDGGGAIVDINVTPLVDITLVLLIIFMVTARFIVKPEPAIKVELPKASSGSDVVEQTLTFVLGPPAAGQTEPQLLVNGILGDWDSARRDIAAVLKKNPKVQAIIAADRSLRYEHVVKLIDLVKGGGVQNFALTYDPVKTGNPKP